MTIMFIMCVADIYIQIEKQNTMPQKSRTNYNQNTINWYDKPL